MTRLIRLRENPVVGPLEWRVEQLGGWTDELEEWAHDLSEQLFGISEYDIDTDEQLYPVLRMMRDEADAYWAAHGWDVTNGEGKLLNVMKYLTRPLVCVVEKRHPDAGYIASVDDWAASLEADAKRFKPTR